MRRTIRFAVPLLMFLFIGAGARGLETLDPPLRQWAAPPFWSPPGEQASGSEGSPHLTVEKASAPAVSPPAFAFVAIAPCRQYNSLNATPLLQGENRSVTLTGAPCGIPAGAVAVSANITVFNITGATGNGVFKLDTVSPPAVAWINYPPTEAQRGNAGVVALNASGQIIVQVAQGAGQVDFVVDVNGYYTATGIVNSLNGLNGDVALAAGTDLSLAAVGQTLTLSANSASANTANTLVRRDGSGNFTAGTITGNLAGNVTGAASANVLKTGDTMTGDLGFALGNIILPSSTTSGGSILKNFQRFLHDSGSFNVFVGLNAGNFTMSGAGNTATGVNALSSNTMGGNNTASGVNALFSNTTGQNNVATGASALYSNTTGGDNTALGVNALTNNNGFGNTAIGSLALYTNNGGFSNTATGVSALSRNTGGSSNTATGSGALINNTTGSHNTATGSGALSVNSSADNNTATGSGALNNSTGANNTASGVNALSNNTAGSNNVALGYQAGLNLTTGSSNIDIGNQGVAGEGNTIRIGVQGTQTSTFIAGIIGSTSVLGVGVFVNANGLLGTMTSSARFKDDIRDIGAASEGLLKLRPVSFRYKAELDPTGSEQYGLVAEEVAQVYPDLVTCDDEGRPLTVRYHFLVPMLLNEVQKDRRTIEGQRAQIEDQRAEMRDLKGRLERLEALFAASGRQGNTVKGP